MTRSPLAPLVAGAFLLLSVVAAPRARADEPADELAKALKKAASADSYAFTVEEMPGAGSGGGLEAKYQKGQPLWCKADKIEFYKQGDAVVYRDGEQWQRSKRGTLSDPLRVLGAVAKVNVVRLPHEELAGFEKLLKEVRPAKDKEDGNTVYGADLTDEAVKKLARTEHRDVARSGSARVWVDDKGNVVKYVVTLKLQGRVGNAEIDGTATRTTTLSGAGGTKVEVPEAAKKALE
jgi:hypothetical protein